MVVGRLRKVGEAREVEMRAREAARWRARGKRRGRSIW
jgi:hypothetical protein